MTTTNHVNPSIIDNSAYNDAVRFLTAVLPPRRDNEAYRIEIFNRPPDIPPPFNNFRNIEKMATGLLEYGQQANAYFAVCTFPAGGKDRLAEHALRLGVIPADIDIGPGKGYPTIEDALAAIRRFALPPSVILYSGRGLHVYWKLREPAEDTEGADRLSQAIRLIRGLAGVLHGDPNIAMKTLVLRVPGTMNIDSTVNKKDGKDYPTGLLEIHEDRTYTLEDFLEVGVPEILAVRERISEDADLGEFILSADTDLSRELFEAAYANAAKFRASWDHERGWVKADGTDDTSTYDQSLASIVARMGWPPDQAAALLRVHRERYGANPEKALRPDYAERTLKIAYGVQRDPEDEELSIEIPGDTDGSVKEIVLKYERLLREKDKDNAMLLARIDELERTVAGQQTLAAEGIEAKEDRRLIMDILANPGLDPTEARVTMLFTLDIEATLSHAAEGDLLMSKNPDLPLVNKDRQALVTVGGEWGIAKKAGVTKGTADRVIAQLIEKGFIRKADKPVHLRTPIIDRETGEIVSYRPQLHNYYGFAEVGAGEDTRMKTRREIWRDLKDLNLKAEKPPRKVGSGYPRCNDHPNADVIRQETYTCAECGVQVWASDPQRIKRLAVEESPGPIGENFDYRDESADLLSNVVVRTIPQKISTIGAEPPPDPPPLPCACGKWLWQYIPDDGRFVCVGCGTVLEEQS